MENKFVAKLVCPSLKKKNEVDWLIYQNKFLNILEYQEVIRRNNDNLLLNEIEAKGLTIHVMFKDRTFYNWQWFL